jgi:lipopolysaccharide export system protein LptA
MLYSFCIYFLIFSFLSTLLTEARPPLLVPSLIPGFDFGSVVEDAKTKKPRVPTSWGGNSLTQETKPVQGIPFTVYMLSGGAWIYHRKVKLSAYQIEVIGEDALMGYLKGGVKVEDKENKINLTANKGTYNKFEETIVLEGRPTLYYMNAENKPTKVTARQIKRYMQENKIVMEGGVIIQDPDYTILAEGAVYLETEKNMVLENHPLIFGDKLFLTGEKAIYNNDSKVTSLEKETFILRLSYETKSVNTEEEESKKKLSTKKPEKELEEKERVLTLFTGERIESRLGDESTPRSVGMFENARIYHRDYEYSGKYLKALGEGYKDLEAKEDVAFWDKENRVRICGKLFEHKDAEDYTHVTDDPYIEFLSQEGEVNSTLRSYEIERFGDKKEIVARGNVTIEGNDAFIRGQIATYYEDEKKIIVEGNPTLEREGSKIRSGKIIIYPEDNRILLSEGIDSKESKGKP